MTFENAKHASPVRGPRQTTVRLITVCALTLLMAACRHGDEGPQVAGWTLIDHAQRHPILVSQQPTNLSVRVARGSQGLSPQTRAQVLEFAERFRAGDGGNSRLVIQAPSGSANEVSAMHAVGEIRSLLSARGFAESAISVEAYSSERNPEAPIVVSYMRYVAEGPECGNWSANLARQPDNLPYADFGCTTQRNFAAQIANPADLLGPRTMTPRAADRRSSVWDKFVKGETTNAQKGEQETVKVKGN